MKLKRDDITEEELNLLEKQRKIAEKEEQEKQLKKEKRQIEFSKKIMFFVMLTAFVIITFSIYIICKTKNTTSLDVLIVETMNFAKIGVAFYSAKAAVENYQKIKNSTNNNEEMPI
jgi:hypothetical protein